MSRNTLVEQLCDQACQLDEQALQDLQQQPLPADAVHDCRVAVKRLRALWQLLRPWLCRDDHRAFDQTIRRAANALSGARDTHVMAATLQRLASRADGSERQSLSRVAATLFLHSDLPPTDTHHDDAVRAFALDRQHWQTLSVTPGDHELLVTGLARTYKQCRNRTIKAQGSSSPEPWHDLRKWVKYLHYQQQALAAHAIVTATPDADLERLGKKLGKLHDLHMLREHVQLHRQAIEKHKDLARTLEAIRQREKRLMTQCQTQSQRLFQTPAKKWVTALS